MVSFGSRFRRAAAPLMGIDVGSSSLKLVECQPGVGGAYRLLHAEAEPLAPGCVHEGHIERFDEVVAALRQLVQRSGSPTRRVALALPNAAVITRRVSVPTGLSPDALEIAIEAQAGQALPFPLSEVNLDFCALGPDPAQPGMWVYLMSAARKEAVWERQQLVAAAGLQAVVLDIESHAARLAATCLAPPGCLGPSEAVALFELGALRSHLQVLCDQEVVYERDQAFGGGQLTELLAQEPGGAWSVAESRKRALTASDPDALALSQRVAQEVARALQLFFASGRRKRLDRVLLLGGTAALPGLEEAVGQHTALPVRALNPFACMQGGLPWTQWQAPPAAFWLASGLALRGSAS
jgi:type IV pilus assembly protein PilM